MAVQKAQSLLAGYHTAGLGQAVAVHGPRSLKCLPRHPRATGLLLDTSANGRGRGMGFVCVLGGDKAESVSIAGELQTGRVRWDDPDNPEHTPEIRADVVRIAQLMRNRHAIQRNLPPGVPVVNQIRIYWWCSPPRTGRQRMCPVRSTARETGVSFSKDRCVRTSL
jgi:hypothetical protein